MIDFNRRFKPPPVARKTQRNTKWKLLSERLERAFAYYERGDVPQDNVAVVKVFRSVNAAIAILYREQESCDFTESYVRHLEDCVAKVVQRFAPMVAALRAEAERREKEKQP